MIVIQGEIHSSKNSRRIVRNRQGRQFIVKSRASEADEATLALQLNTQRGTWDAMIQGQEFPLYVTFCFTRRTRSRWDFVNLVQGVADAMVKAGYLPDDDVAHFIPVYGGYEINKDNPGVSFWVEG